MLARSKNHLTLRQKFEAASLLSRLTPHMRALNAFLEQQTEAFEPEIREMVEYCLATRGKRLRPSLAFFAGWTKDGAVAEPLVKVAAVIELVHLATLVHDDILDSADLRHSRETASRRYGAEAAVLLGDALFAHAVHLTTRFPDSTVCHHVSAATRRVCAGEISQTLNRRNPDFSREHYFRVIEMKTAELFSVSCFLGAHLGGYPAEFVDAAGRFGRSLGVAYQIYDDLVDYLGSEDQIGKTLGTDFASGKFTLPLLVLLEKLKPPERKACLQDLQSGDDERIRKRVGQMQDLGVPSEILRVVYRHAESAESALVPFSDLPPFGCLTGLSALIRKQAGNLGG